MKIVKSMILLIVILLTGCQTTDKPVSYLAHDHPLWIAHLDNLNQIEQYRASGQLGYISKDERFSVNFNCDYKNPNDFSFYLSSGLSSKSLYIEMTNHGLAITDNLGNKRFDANANELLKQTFNLDVPLDKVVIWLKGAVDTKTQNVNYNVNQNGLLDNFSYHTQDKSWQVKYSEYKLNLNPKLPENILITANDYKLKINIKTWQY